MSALDDSANALDDFFAVNSESSLAQIMLLNNNITDDLNAVFSQRKRLYEEQNISLQNDIHTDDVSDFEDIDSVQELKERVIEAKKKISSEIIEYNTLLDKQKLYDQCLLDISSTKSVLAKFVKDFAEPNMDLLDLDPPDNNILQDIAKMYKNKFEELQLIVSGKRDAAQNKINKKVKRIKFMASMYNNLMTSAFGPICPVCLSKQVQVYLDPCGHSFCSECIRSTFCYICRNKFTKASKLYFS